MGLGYLINKSQIQLQGIGNLTAEGYINQLPIKIGSVTIYLDLIVAELKFTPHQKTITIYDNILPLVDTNEIDSHPRGIIDRIREELNRISPDLSKSTKSMIIRILNNIVKNPSLDKFRRINRTVVDKYSKLSDILTLLGFDDEGNKKVLCRQETEMLHKVITRLSPEVC